MFQYSGQYQPQPKTDFSITHGGNMLPGLQALSSGLEVIGEQREKKQALARAEAKYKAIREGIASMEGMSDYDRAMKTAELMGRFTELTKVIDMQANWAATAAGLHPGKQVVQDALRDVHLNKDNGAALQTLYQARQRVQEMGIPTPKLDQHIEGWEANPEQMRETTATDWTMIDSKRAPEFLKAEKEQREEQFKERELAVKERPDWQRATGKGMEGWSFNPATNEWRMNENMRAGMQERAAQYAEGEPLDSKKLVDVNNSVTKLTAKPREIRAAAASLDALRKNASPAARLSAVFAFMKSLDPTSVVRETEQGQVYKATGLASQLAGMMNSLLGKGKLTDEGFNDLVRTSKVLANSAIDSGQQDAKSYLEVIRPNLSPRQFDKLNERVPIPFDIGTDNKEIPGAEGGENVVGASTSDPAGLF